jgi:DNA-directed RNA polymerase specialized sigma subunit
LLAIVAPQVEAELAEQLSRKTFSEQAKAILKHLVAGQRPGIVLNEALMKLRKQRTFREESLDNNFLSESDALPKDLVDWSPNPQEIYGEVELREILIKCLGSLQPALRVVFVLRDIEELSISETCEALSLSAAASKRACFALGSNSGKH